MQYCDHLIGVCLEPKDWLNLWLSFAAVVISFISLVIAIRFASKSFRPIVSVAVKTQASGNIAIAYSLEVLNSGAIPAKSIRIKAVRSDIEAALEPGHKKEREREWLSCFQPECVIPILQNGEKVSCAFGLSSEDGSGFWKYGASIPVVVEYIGWFGSRYSEAQVIHIQNSESFTGYLWSSHA